MAQQTVAGPKGQLAYIHHAGSSPGVLFCTGFNSDMGGTKALVLDDWCRQQGRQFTRFDYSGHGLSAGRFEDGGIDQWLRDALVILDEVCDGPQVLVGSSMGGWMMLLIALARPERVVGLLGIASAPDFTRAMRERRLSSAQLKSLAETGFCEIENHYDDGQPYRIGRQLLEEGEQHLLLGAEIGIDAPVRLIHGQADADVPWQLSLQVAELLRSVDVELQLVKHGDHRLSTPADLARLLRTLENLLDQLSRGAAT